MNIQNLKTLSFLVQKKETVFESKKFMTAFVCYKRPSMTSEKSFITMKCVPEVNHSEFLRHAT